MNATDSNKSKSKWGYHACDKQTYFKLKALHKVYHQTVRDVASWNRWNAKQPQNRVVRPKLRHPDGHPYGYGEPDTRHTSLAGASLTASGHAPRPTEEDLP